ncbi:hypothetical protein L1887_50313 [Cichorium endivia]|nr:hypothetical protein L1887_50313 [Cichorium endivia]
MPHQSRRRPVGPAPGLRSCRERVCSLEFSGRCGKSHTRSVGSCPKAPRLVCATRLPPPSLCARTFDARLAPAACQRSHQRYLTSHIQHEAAPSEPSLQRSSSSPVCPVRLTPLPIGRPSTVATSASTSCSRPESILSQADRRASHSTYVAVQSLCL